MNSLQRQTLLLVKGSVLPILFFSAMRCGAQSRPSVLALSKTDHTLAIVDPVTFNVVARIPVGTDPHEVIASLDGKTAYVTIYGGGSLHEINVIDLIAQKPLTNVDTRPLFGPHGIVFINGKVWFSAEGSKAVGRYDPLTGKLDWSMGTGQDRTHMIYVTADGKNIYTTNVNSGTVSILTDSLIPPPPNAPANARPREDWLQTIVPTAPGSEGFDVSPDGRELWTAANADGRISIIDLAAKKLSTKIDAKVIGANRLKFTPNGKLVLISSLQLSDLTIYDAKSRKEVKRLKIGRGAAGILMDPDGSRAFVACTPDNYVAIMILKVWKLFGTLMLAAHQTDLLGQLGDESFRTASYYVEIKIVRSLVHAGCLSVLDEKFTMGQLQKLYEAVYQKNLYVQTFNERY